MDTFKNHINPFENNSGSMRVTKLNSAIILLVFMSFLGLIIIKTEVAGVIFCVGLFFVTALVYAIFKIPKIH